MRTDLLGVPDPLRRQTLSTEAMVAAPAGTVPGIAKGLAKGHIVTKRVLRSKPSNGKGKLGARTVLVRDVIRSVAGFAPYEKRIMELIKGGGVNSQKRAMRFAKKRLGTHKRAKAKFSELSESMNK
uniref:60S ribosomal protein L36 n=1 Tax=Spongospora subterranea TaxID=70186 RepID=A0A0H5QI53_9EUKA|eukprot:CRZ01019.1 hypothetical protein [Spongospora subterranea]